MFTKKSTFANVKKHIMTITLENLMFFLAPALLVGIAVYLVLNKLLSAEAERRRVETITESRKITIPMRLQAYERLVLFLERITPDSLVLRTQQAKMQSKDLHLALLIGVRSEFEHNLSQQLYVSANAWEAVRAAKESIIIHINSLAENVSPDSPSIDYARLLVEEYIGGEKRDLIAAAKNILCDEAKKIF